MGFLKTVLIKLTYNKPPKILLLAFFLMGGLVLGHSQTFQKRRGIYKNHKSNIAEQRNNKMANKKKMHTKNWNQSNKAKNSFFLKRKKKR